MNDLNTHSMSIKNTSKESIRSRLLKNAAHFWGQQNVHNLDPFIRLLMESLSTELYKAYNEIETTDARILEKITRLLTPELYVSPRPAHAVAYLRIHEPGQVLNAYNQFYSQQRIATREEGILDAEYPVVFTPLGNIRLYDGDIRYLATSDSLYSFNNARNRTYLGGAQRPLPPRKVWIGLDINAQEDLASLNCYMNFNVHVEDWMYTLLAAAKWSANGIPLQVRSGLSFHNEQAGITDERNVFADYEIMKLIETDIKTHYQRFFVTIDNLNEVRKSAGQQEPPTVLKDAFGNVDAFNAAHNILWIEIEFPSYFTATVLEQLTFTINAFPVVNRKLQHFFHRLRDINKIIPLISDAHEHFLSVASLSDDKGRNYQALPFRSSTEQSGYYSVKYGGTERFDERNAQEYLSYLSELLRDEVAAFAAYGKDFVKSIVSELSQKIKLVNQKIQGDDNKHREIPTYLMVDPIDNQEANMEVRYWITNSTLANNIRAGSELMRLQTSLLINNSPILLTTTAGGRDQLKTNDRLNAYKYTLTTRNRLVTYEDIKSFCRLHLGNKIREVNVQKGVGVGIHGYEGIMSTTDIVLQPAMGDLTPKTEWDTICTELKEQIIARSIHGNMYRVMLQP